MQATCRTDRGTLSATSFHGGIHFGILCHGSIGVLRCDERGNLVLVINDEMVERHGVKVMHVREGLDD